MKFDRELVVRKGKELGRQVAVNGVGRVDFEPGDATRYRITVVADRVHGDRYFVIFEGDRYPEMEWNGEAGFEAIEENPEPDFTWAPWVSGSRKVIAVLLDSAAHWMEMLS